MGLLNPIMAGAIHIVHTAGVVANSSRLLRYEPDKLDAAADTTETLQTDMSATPKLM
jgi:cation-transporting P-type ATPase C